MTQTAKPKRKGTALQNYTLEGAPRELLEEARAKARTEEPPISLKWKIIELLRAYVAGSSPLCPP